MESEGWAGGWKQKVGQGYGWRLWAAVQGGEQRQVAKEEGCGPGKEVLGQG